VDFVAIDANPRFISPDDLVAFDDQENLEHLGNWLYLTGSLPQLEKIWGAYGIVVGYASGGAMIAHSDTAYVINRREGFAMSSIRTPVRPPRQPSPPSQRRWPTPSGARATAHERVLPLEHDDGPVVRRARSRGVRHAHRRVGLDRQGHHPFRADAARYVVQSSAGTWVTLPMGRLNQPLNTFWQLFFRPTGMTTWNDKVGATATATNGGLIMAAAVAQPFVVGCDRRTCSTSHPSLPRLTRGTRGAMGCCRKGWQTVRTRCRSHPMVAPLPS